MAITKTQSVTGNGATLTLNGVAANAFLSLQDAYLRDPGTGLAEAAPTDTQGTWSTANADVPPTLSTNGDRGVGIFYQAGVASGTHTVTPEANSFHETVLAEWAGIVTSNPFDVGTSAKSTAANHTSQATGTTGVTAQASELVLINCVEDSTTGTANIGWTDPVAGFTTLLKISDDTTDLPTLPSFMVVSATGTQSATFNWTDSKPVQTSMANIATFKGSGTVDDAVYSYDDASNQPPLDPDEMPGLQEFISDPLSANFPAQVDQFIAYFPDEAEEPEEDWLFNDFMVAPPEDPVWVYVEDGSLQPVEPEEISEVQGFELAPLAANFVAADLIVAEDGSMQPGEDEERADGFFDMPLTALGPVVSTVVHSWRKGVSRTHVKG